MSNMKESLSKLKVKYDSIPVPAKASLWFTLCSIVQKGIALLTTPIFTRMLTTEQYGVYTVYQSWYQIIIIFATLNMFFGVYNNGITKNPEDKEGYTSSLLGLSSVVTVGLFAIVSLGIDWWSGMLDLSPLLICVLFVQLIFESAFQYWAASQRYNYKYRALVAVTIVNALVGSVLGVILVQTTPHKAEARIISLVLIQALIGLGCYIVIMAKGKKFFSLKYWKYALGFSLPLIPHYLSGTLLNQVDRLMIAAMVGKGQAAIYGVAYNVAMMMTIITNAINNSFIPYSYKELKEKRYDGIRKNSEMLMILVAGLCVVAMVFCPEIIAIFASPEYGEAIWVMPPIAASVFFMFLYPLFGNIEFYYEKTKFVAFSSCVAAVLNLVLNYVFIGMFGYYAAGYTTLVCYMIYSLMHYIFYKKILKESTEVKSIYSEKFMIVISVIVLAFMFSMTLVYRYTLVRYGILVVLMMICFIKRKFIIDGLKTLRK